MPVCALFISIKYTFSFIKTNVDGVNILLIFHCGGTVPVQADAGEEERCHVFDPVCEALEVPDHRVVQVDPVDYIHRRHQAEVGVQHSHVKDEHVGRGALAFMHGDVPHHHYVDGDAYDQVHDFDTKVEEKAIWSHRALFKLVPWKEMPPRGCSIHVGLRDVAHFTEMR